MTGSISFIELPRAYFKKTLLYLGINLGVALIPFMLF